MALRDLTERSAVLQALAEADELGEPAFLAKYGFDPSRRYRLQHDGKTYAPKAILGAAHGVQFPAIGPLGPSEFSGGHETNSKARELGFSIAELERPIDDLSVALKRFMELFGEARQTRFGHNHPAVAALHESADVIQGLLPASLAGSIVRPSVGQGNWAAVPWISVLHPAVTRTTQHGVYPVLLFREDMRAVEIAIAQGVTDLKQSLGRRAAVVELDRRAVQLRAHLRALEAHGFRLDAGFDLGTSALGRDYVASTVVHRPYTVEDLDEGGTADSVRALLAAYGELLTSGELDRVASTVDGEASAQALVIYVSRSAEANFESGGRAGWWGWKEAPNNLETLRPGDLVAFGRGFDGGSPRVEHSVWQQRALQDVVVGRVTTTPERTDELVMPDELRGEASYPWKFRFEVVGSERDVPLAPGARLSEDASEAFRRSGVSRGIGVLVPVEGSPLLENYLEDAPAPVAATADGVAAVGGAFASAVEASGLRLPRAEVDAFVAALMAKPFAILTGQSGSGKTQLAMRLGEWLGSDDQGRPRCLVVPVRPDWTGPEYLFGYPDALRSGNGRDVWAVPDALEFMLRAHDEPREPYLLVLDEMNLAHVERYFADFLSGLESRHPVLPELKQSGGEWHATGNTQRLPLPRNLLVVGTVNVDETTYLFSPKVLDRAFTFEFRTRSTDLDPTLRRPSTLGPGSPEHRRTISAVLADDEWQHANPHPDLEALAGDLVAIHDVLSPSGHDFGHRVFFEALRYASLLATMKVGDRWAVMDRVALTKVLPKIHGTRARVEAPLRDLREFAGGEDEEASGPRMPLTARKLDRMLTLLVEAQFVSFTE